MHNQNFLNKYFTHNWSSSTSKYIYSGYAILDKLSESEKVIDIGCGTNPFKGRIKNLTGIDPINNGADIVTTLEDFETNEKFSAALCLGSINFGDEHIIANQIKKVNDLLLPNAKVFWRLNPGKQDHASPLCNEIDFYPWTFEKLEEFANKYGFDQIKCEVDTNGEHERLYVEWVRASFKSSLRWEGDLEYEYSQYAILNKINPKTDHVIDIGCACNMFHGKIENLVAIDPIHPDSLQIDVPPYIVKSLRFFETEQKFDVALCLGSMLFGNEEAMSKNILKINSLLKPNAKVFWRLRMPGDWPGPHFYPWTFEKLQGFAELYGFTQQNAQLDTNAAGINPRLYVEWVR